MVPLPTRIGRYAVRRRIGSGGFATVWLGYDDQLDSPVAIKVLADNWAGDHHVKQRFVDEGRFLRKVESPHVVPVYDGTSDEVQRYDGYIRSFGRLLSVTETTEYWRRADGCTGQSTTPLPHLNPHDLTRASLVQWSGCRPDTGIQLYRIENGGHCWPRLAPPGPADPADGPRFGGCSNDIETAAEVWNFFRRYRGA